MFRLLSHKPLVDPVAAHRLGWRPKETGEPRVALVEAAMQNNFIESVVGAHLGTALGLLQASAAFASCGWVAPVCASTTDSMSAVL